MAATAHIHPQALCESANVGADTRVWAFAHILPGAKIGSDCNICDGVFVENDVIVGDRVTVKCGVQLWDGIEIEDDVFIGPNATFTNDRFPRSKQKQASVARTIVRRGASIGANATILPGLEIGSGSMIGAGAVVTRSVPPNAIVVGNPGRITGYVNAAPVQSAQPDVALSETDAGPLGVGAAALHRIRQLRDIRGSLVVGEFERDIPFPVKRYFAIFDVPTREVRGEHAHKQCQQFLVCLRGSVNVVLDDGKKRCEVVLDRADRGVLIPAMIWGTQYRHSGDSVLLVFASHYYDPEDYIRRYDDFLAALKEPRR